MNTKEHISQDTPYDPLMQWLMSDEYAMHYARPKMDKSETIIMDKGSIYKGVLSVKNEGDEAFFGMLKSESDFVSLEEDLFYCHDKELQIRYTIDGKDFLEDSQYVGHIGLYYLGGYTKLTVSCRTNVLVEPIDSYIEREEGWLEVTSNRVSYSKEDSGFFTIKSAIKESVTLKIIQTSPYVVLENDLYELTGELEIPFKVSVPEAHISKGLIPLRTAPSAQAEVVFMCQHLGVRSKVKSSITLTTYKHCTSKGHKKSKEINFEILDQEIEKNHIDYFIVGQKNKKKEIIKRQLQLLELKMYEDVSNVINKLTYVLWLIEGGFVKKAETIMNEIEGFMLYYDQFDRDISDLLMCFISVIRQDSMNKIRIRNWRFDNNPSDLKLLVLHIYGEMLGTHYRQLTSNDTCDYSDLMYMVIFHYLNRVALLPVEADVLYGDTIACGLMYQGLSAKLMKRLESSAYLVSKNQLLSFEVSKKLYEEHTSKSFLTLLVVTAIKEELTSNEVLLLYIEALKLKLPIPDLTIYYIIASYKNQVLLDLEYVPLAMELNRFTDNCRQYMLYNLTLQKASYPVLFNHYSNNYPNIELDDQLVILSEDMSVNMGLVDTLMEQANTKMLLTCYDKGLIKAIPKEKQLLLVRPFNQINPKKAYQLAIGLFREGVMDQFSLEVISIGFNDDFYDRMDIMRVIKSKGLFNEKLYTEFLIMSILTRQNLNFVVSCLGLWGNHFKDTLVEQLIYKYISAQIIIEDYEGNEEIARRLLAANNIQGDIRYEIALLSMCSKSEDLRDKLADEVDLLLEKHMTKGVVFPFYKGLVRDDYSGYNFKVHHYFEYYAHANQQLNFCYRLDESETFIKQPMSHIVFGLFLAKVVLFYGEVLQYYIEIIDKDGYDVIVSDLYIEENTYEVDDHENLFDLVNTITMSRSMLDDESLEASIDTYKQLHEEKLGKTYLL